jgi:hypothetical protein
MIVAFTANYLRKFHQRIAGRNNTAKLCGIPGRTSFWWKLRYSLVAVFFVEVAVFLVEVAVFLVEVAVFLVEVAVFPVEVAVFRFGSQRFAGSWSRKYPRVGWKYFIINSKSWMENFLLSTISELDGEIS